jgi:hypothetical protein
MAIRRCTSLSSTASRSGTHPPYVKRFGAICPEKSTEPPSHLNCYTFSSLSDKLYSRTWQSNTPIRKPLALGALACQDSRKAKAVELRFFGGPTPQKTAEHGSCAKSDELLPKALA